MVEQHVRSLMTEFIFREVVHDWKDRKSLENKFIEAPNETSAVNQIGYALGHVSRELDDISLFETKYLLEKQKYELLLSVVKRMSSLEFIIIPLVLIRKNEGILQMAIMRVRKKSGDDENTEYVDMFKRRYESFPEFLRSNKLDPGVLWFPKDGVIQFDEKKGLLVSSCSIAKRSAATWKNLAIAGSTAATVLSLTPVAPVVTPMLLLAINVPLIGFSVADLVDGFKHERHTVIVGLSAALIVNLVTFSSVGLTVACKTNRLRRLLPADKLLQLEKAEQFMQATAKTATLPTIVYSVIGSVAGWQNLSGAEWAQMAANLCLAYRESISKETAKALFQLLQERGLVQFFRNTCANISMGILKERLYKHGFQKMLNLVMDVLQHSVQFTVDDDFTTLCVYGYQLQFQTLFQIDKDRIKYLLNYLSSIATQTIKICSVKHGFTQEVLDGVLQLLQLVSRLKDVRFELGAYVTIGKGHKYSFDTVLTFLNTPTDSQHDLLMALTSLNVEQTKQLNNLRATKIKDGGDADFFGWLVGSELKSHTEYVNALNWLLWFAEHNKSEQIVFDKRQIVVNSLLSVSVCDVCRNCNNPDPILLHDTRFLQLCKDTEECQQDSKLVLVKRAKVVWFRTCSESRMDMQLETIALLKNLFAGSHSHSVTPPLTLAEALDYALHYKAATVRSVYYSIIFAWNVLTKEKDTTLDNSALMARFEQLMDDASSLNMHRTISLKSNNIAESEEDEQRIATARLVHTHLKYGPNYVAPPYFGSRERAACWLQLVPSLRHMVGRGQFNRTVRYLVKKCDAKVLLNEEGQDGTKLPTGEKAHRVMFARGKMKVVIEMVSSDRQWNASVLLCSLSATEAKAPDNDSQYH